MEEENKQEAIHEKGFDLYNKIKIGKKTLNDAILDVDSLTCGTYRYAGNRMFTDKRVILDALDRKDLEMIRAISNYFYRTSGIYQRACNYFATLYRYDWYITPKIRDKNISEDKILTDFNDILDFLDASHVSKTCGDIALSVLKNGAYYGYIASDEDNIVLQELPVKYCRSIYSVKGTPAVEFNMRFFDEMFPNTSYRNKILNLFPKEFKVGYDLYKKGELIDETTWNKNPLDAYGIHSNGWYLLDPDSTVKFSFQNEDFPLFINSVTAILDLDGAQGLERKRQAQQLVKILIQKLPLNKNNDLIFDVDEARDIHQNAVSMLKNTVGLDVLTTFADVDDIDLSDTSEASNNALDNATDAVYRSLGISENLFDTDGNLALDKSILNDEASVRTLLKQFEVFFDKIVQLKSSKPKKYKFRFYMLETTQNNYKDLSDKYKALVQLGNSKILPEIALGHSQSSIIDAAYFENQILNLSAVMLPPLQSSVMNAETIQALGKQAQTVNDATQGNTEDSTVGRPEKADSEKSDKTIANQESMS